MRQPVAMPSDGVCHAHAAWACFPVKTYVYEDVVMARLTTRHHYPSRTTIAVSEQCKLH